MDSPRPILEGIVTTISSEGSLNIAPMGPQVDPAMDRFVLRPFQTSQTYRNLRFLGQGVLHVIDDVLLLARAAIDRLQPMPAVFPAKLVHGFVLKDCCRYFEFEVVTLDDRQERTRIEARVVRADRLRDFFGFNRAKHAVVEAAILATRTDFLPLEEIRAEYRRLAVLVQKTGGRQEHEAFKVLEEFVAQVERQRKEHVS
jgi:uncharacterized protein